jgi:dephospho-CoA kinase
MLKIGITGGIGSGKSTVAKLFEVLGIPVYYADDAARKLMQHNDDLKKQITNLFGEDAYSNGILNRKLIATTAFENPQKLAQLNAIVHPLTLQDAENWMRKQTTSYAIKEAALIFESGAQKHLDYIIGVSAPAPLRLQRVMQRDNISREEVLARMNKQVDEVIKMRLCDFVIYNDEQQLVIPQIVQLHQQLLALSAKK